MPGLLLFASILTVVACADDLTAPAFRPEVTNTSESFRFTATELQVHNARHHYLWPNRDSVAVVTLAPQLGAGNGTLSIRAADGSLVYSAGLDERGSDTSAVGVPGVWKIAIRFEGVRGDLSFELKPRSQLEPAHTTQGTAARPNVILILTDDQESSSLGYMPRLRRLIADAGMTFENFFVSFPACCPSRASLLRGQYVHNHRVWHNGPHATGGFLAFHEQGHESSTIATWLDAAGYRTALVGKYLNFYGEVGPVHVPPGWNEWYAIFGPPISGLRQPYYGYFMNENGKVRQYGDSEGDYLTDVLAERALDFIRRATASGEPFFLYWAPYAPHSPATPAPRHQGMFAGVAAPRPPSFNEPDVRDKPRSQQHPPLSDRDLRRIDELYPLMLASLQSVDEAIERMVALLDSLGALERTYMFYASDNGFRLGQHRQPAGKGDLYEEQIRIPMFVRGPAIPSGMSRQQLVSIIDLAPTIAELAGATPASVVDGRSLVPLLGGGSPPWRNALLVEHVTRATALRTHRHVYVEWPDLIVESLGSQLTVPQRELYDLIEDPFQLENAYSTGDPALLQHFAGWTDRLRTCAGAACRDAELDELGLER